MGSQGESGSRAGEQKVLPRAPGIQVHAQERECDLTVVVPAFNEEHRLPTTLSSMVKYFAARSESVEIVVVDDGSSDGTVDVVEAFLRTAHNVRLIALPANAGKGAAVRAGVLGSRGTHVLFADADGASPIEEYPKLKNAIRDGCLIAIGSRAAASTTTSVKSPLYRRILGRLFNAWVSALAVPGIADTQCGFKLFSRDAALFIFERQQSNRFSFDIEILLIAHRAGIKVAEVPINWTAVEGSKVHVLKDGLAMLRDAVKFRRMHSDVNEGSFARWLQLSRTLQIPIRSQDPCLPRSP